MKLTVVAALLALVCACDKKEDAKVHVKTPDGTEVKVGEGGVDVKTPAASTKVGAGGDVAVDTPAAAVELSDQALVGFIGEYVEIKDRLCACADKACAEKEKAAADAHEVKGNGLKVPEAEEKVFEERVEKVEGWVNECADKHGVK